MLDINLSIQQSSSSVTSSSCQDSAFCPCCALDCSAPGGRWEGSNTLALNSQWPLQVVFQSWLENINSLIQTPQRTKHQHETAKAATHHLWLPMLKPQTHKWVSQNPLILSPLLLQKAKATQVCAPPHSSNVSNACCLPWHEEMEQFAETSLKNQTDQNESGPLGSYQQCELAHRGTAWREVSALGPAAVAQVWRTRSHVLTLVSSWALARLSTAMAKKTFRSVSVGE